MLIGALNAASNITGVLTDTNAFSAMLHTYGALALWDYATAGVCVLIKTGCFSIITFISYF